MATLRDPGVVYFWLYTETTFARAQRARGEEKATSYGFVDLALKASAEKIGSKNNGG
jgi:hypothetical protein